jgi:predicted ATPase/DNA-binding CsgD family transcriptional regulator
MTPVLHSPDFPAPTTNLIGREQELGAIAELFAENGVRLVTLTGPGGVGKTRLAVAIAEAVAGSFRNGVAFASLAPIRDPALVFATIAQAVNVRERAGRTPKEGLAGELSQRELLLILDNFETVSEAAADIAWLLGVTTGIRLLVTSRSRLQIRGEHEFVVQPLPLPPATETSHEDLEQNPAVQLFLERAREVRPETELSDATAPAIAEICRRLDGLPLAIELAAARVKVLPPAALSARLDRRLPLLVGGPRDLPDRLRTMRAAIAWSYDLLLPDQQALFRHLSVFAGGFSQHEAESVVNGVAESRQDGPDATSGPDPGPSDPPPLIDGLSGLVDNSMIQQDELELEPSFRMLETLREFGSEELERQGELDLLRDRHADFFIGLAEAAMFRLRGAERTSWLDRLERAHDNTRAALTWLCERQDTARAIRLAGALWQFWWWRSHLAEGRQRLEQVLALPGASMQGDSWARVLTGAGALSETQGDYEAAESYHDRAVASWQKLGDDRGLATSLLFRWLVAFNAGDLERMAAHSSESLRLFTGLDDQWGIAMSYMEQGVEAMRREANDEADLSLAKGIAGFKAIEDRWGVAICNGVAGNVATNRKDYAGAARMLKESLSDLLLLDDLWGVATVMPASARLAMEQKAYEHGVRISGAIAGMHHTMGAPLKIPFRIRFEENLDRAKKALGEERFDRVFSEGHMMTPAEAVQTAKIPIESGKAVIEPSAFDALPFKLSPRELEVLRVHVRGLSAKEVGDELFISVSTVRTHIENIKNKFGVSTNREVIAYAFEHKLV